VPSRAILLGRGSATCRRHVVRSRPTRYSRFSDSYGTVAIFVYVPDAIRICACPLDCNKEDPARFRVLIWAFSLPDLSGDRGHASASFWRGFYPLAAKLRSYSADQPRILRWDSLARIRSAEGKDITSLWRPPSVRRLCSPPHARTTLYLLGRVRSQQAAGRRMPFRRSQPCRSMRQTGLNKSSGEQKNKKKKKKQKNKKKKKKKKYLWAKCNVAGLDQHPRSVRSSRASVPGRDRLCPDSPCVSDLGLSSPTVVALNPEEEPPVTGDGAASSGGGQASAITVNPVFAVLRHNARLKVSKYPTQNRARCARNESVG